MAGLTGAGDSDPAAGVAPAPTPSRPDAQFTYGYDVSEEHPDVWTFLESLLDGTWATWMGDPGYWVEFRGFWEPPADDPPGVPPVLPQPSVGEWGYWLVGGYEFTDPYDSPWTPAWVYPAGSLFATTKRDWEGGQISTGDWSGPGFLFSWRRRYLTSHLRDQPPA